jgi:trehalose 6-phosphate phosphatase
VKPQSLLLPEAASVLQSFATANVLLAFDYDGTLAPIARTPARARMRPSTRDLLDAVARCYPCVVISGRALADIAQRLQHIPLWYVFGNHGSEPASTPTPTDRTDEWVELLTRRLPKDPAVTIENKGHSVTVHYRGASQRATLRREIVEIASTLPDVRVVGGREAVNLLRRNAPDKGWALRYALRAFACDAAIYVGDDDTDEDAFRALSRDRMLSVRIGCPRTRTNAHYYLESQREVDTLLERLIALRERRRRHS